MRELLAYSKEGVVEEKLTLRIRADSSGDVYIPVAWYSFDGTQNCPYNWNVSVDGGAWVNYSGTGWVRGIRVGYWKIPLSIHTVVVRPVVEDYGWLRAFWYKGTEYGSFLINIISDKSYKGYALNNMYSWNYYKAYQYYGCSNLINTDEELLPDTLEVIGDYYRYYEYAGCSSLVSNAEEKILKTVKVIGDYYRAYQYENCYGINKINMRAINWASVWDNYRYNQYSWIATDKKPTDIYIEWWIEEGGDWWLIDAKVKWIYVYKDLVGDYQTKLSWITSSKIQKNPLWDNLEYEFIEYIGLADSNGSIRIPVGGYSTSFTQNCAYDWMVSIDWGEAEEISGTGSATYVSVGSWLTSWSEHRVVIKPKTISWWWGRAFGFHTTWAQAYIKEIIHDSYKCFASSRTSTWAHYKHWVFMGCTNLINSYEKLPTSVETIGASYMSECYAWCTGLKTAFWEVMHKSCSIGDDYRKTEYGGCTGMELHQWMAWYLGTTYPTNYKDNYLLGVGDDAEIYITRLEKMYTLNVISWSYYSWGTMTLATISRAGKYIFSWNLQGTSSNTWFDIEIWKNSTRIYTDTAPDPGTKALRLEIDCVVGDVIQIRKWYEQRYGNINSMKLEFSNVLWLNNNWVKWIYVYVDDLYAYTSSNAWNEIDDNKFQVYYYDYQPRLAVDINKYTNLLGEWSMPSRDTSSNYSYMIWWFSGNLRWVAPYNASSYDVRVPWERYVLNGWTVLWNIYRIRWQWVSWTAQDMGASYDYSTGSGGDMDGNVKAMYIDYKGNMTYATKSRSGSGYTYREAGGRLTQDVSASLDNWETAVCASRDGRYLWWNNRRYYAPTKWWKGTVQYGTYSWNYTDMEFSEDGMVAYLATGFGTITQYNLKAPRDLDGMVSTGKTLNISWSFAFSKDFKYLYVYNGKLKVYEYQE